MEGLFLPREARLQDLLLLLTVFPSTGTEVKNDLTFPGPCLGTLRPLPTPLTSLEADSHCDSCGSRLSALRAATEEAQGTEACCPHTSGMQSFFLLSNNWRLIDIRREKMKENGPESLFACRVHRVTAVNTEKMAGHCGPILHQVNWGL
jgi:hypothetical protein